MAKIKIYGASDDLIEVDVLEGAPNLGEEFDVASGGERFVVLFPTLDVFRVEYGDVWKVEHHASSGRLYVEHVAAPTDEEEREENYTDVAAVTGEIERVECWPSWPPSADDLFEAVEKRLDNDGISDLDPPALRALWKALGGSTLPEAPTA